MRTIVKAGVAAVCSVVIAQSGSAQQTTTQPAAPAPQTAPAQPGPGMGAMGQGMGREMMEMGQKMMGMGQRMEKQEHGTTDQGAAPGSASPRSK